MITGKYVSEELSDDVLAYKASVSYEQNEDIKLVEAYLAHPYATDKRRDIARQDLLFLRGAPRRVLKHKRGWYVGWLRRANAEANGTVIPEDAFRRMSEAGKRVVALRKAAREEREASKAKPPSWLSDPSQLPKRPPGKT